MVFESDCLNISTKLWQPEVLLSSLIMGHFLCVNPEVDNMTIVSLLWYFGKWELDWSMDFKHHRVAAEIL